MSRNICLIISAMLFALVTSVYATPSLGVASDVYAYSSSSALSDEYIKYFADTITPAIDPAYHGFQVGQSGSNLTVFSSYVPWNYDIYFLSNTGGDNFPITYNNQQLVFNGTSAHQIDGYNNPSKIYYQILLPKTQSLWTTHMFGSSTYYLFTAAITYAGSFTPGDHFFALADTNRNGIVEWTDDFSPKTSSAGGFPVNPVPIPEPVSMLLLGTGIAAMALLKKKV